MDSDVTKAEILRRIILTRYKSVRRFAVEMNIPYSTLVTSLERGIDGMAYSTVIRIFEALMLNPVDFSSLEEGGGLSVQITTKRVMEKYNRLNKNGRKRVMDILDDYTKIPEYALEQENPEKPED